MIHMVTYRQTKGAQNKSRQTQFILKSQQQNMFTL